MRWSPGLELCNRSSVLFIQYRFIQSFYSFPRFSFFSCPVTRSRWSWYVYLVTYNLSSFHLNCFFSVRWGLILSQLGMNDIGRQSYRMDFEYLHKLCWLGQMADKTQQSYYSEEAPVFLLAALYAYILHNCSYFLPRQYLVWDTYVTNTVSHWEFTGCAYSRCPLCGCCRPASGRAVRGVSERGPAINEGPR